MKSINDEVFGCLKYDCYWERVYLITMFNRKIDIYLSVTGEEDEEIEEAQRNAFLYFEANKESIIKNAEEELLKYYIQNYEEFADGINEEKLREVLPRISTVKELGKIIEPTMIKFPYSFGSNMNKFGILFGCEWDDEGGIAIRFENQKIVEIGPDDIMLGL